MTTVISQTDFPGLTLRGRGKVRDIYDLGDKLLIVATDRLSPLAVVLPPPLPGKGKVLPQISLYWFETLAGLVPNHVISGTDFTGALAPYAASLRGRGMVVKKTEPLPVECVVRGYISGSGWKDYQKSGAICGIGLPQGLRESDKLPEPIFTPSTKATTGHDENISFEETVKQIGRPLAEKIRDTSLNIYQQASERAAKHGIIIADTKLEFGMRGNKLLWFDDALTPDSSRFWPADQYTPGKAQPSFDKQFVRDYLARIGWNKQAPGPELPADGAQATQAKYREAYAKVTGKPLD